MKHILSLQLRQVSIDIACDLYSPFGSYIFSIGLWAMIILATKKIYENKMADGFCINDKVTVKATMYCDTVWSTKTILFSCGKRKSGITRKSNRIIAHTLTWFVPPCKAPNYNDTHFESSESIECDANAGRYNVHSMYWSWKWSTRYMHPQGVIHTNRMLLCGYAVYVIFMDILLDKQWAWHHGNSLAIFK